MDLVRSNCPTFMLFACSSPAFLYGVSLEFSEYTMTGTMGSSAPSGLAVTGVDPTQGDAGGQCHPLALGLDYAGLSGQVRSCKASEKP